MKQIKRLREKRIECQAIASSKVLPPVLYKEKRVLHMDSSPSINTGSDLEMLCLSLAASLLRSLYIYTVVFKLDRPICSVFNSASSK